MSFVILWAQFTISGRIHSLFLFISISQCMTIDHWMTRVHGPINPFAPARRFAVAELWRFLVALFIDRFRPFFFWSLQHTLICLATLLPHPTRVRLLLQSAGNMAGRRWGSITTFSVTKWPLNLLQKIRFLFCSIYKHSESSQHSFCCKKIKTIAMQGV